MDKFDPLENIIHLEAKTDWLTQELSDYGVSEPLGLIKDRPEDLCWYCHGFVNEKNGKTMVFKNADNEEVAAKVHLQCIPKKSSGTKIDDSDPRSHIGQILKARFPKVNWEGHYEALALKTYLENEYYETSNSEWISALISLINPNINFRKDPFVQVVNRHLSLMMGKDQPFGKMMGYNIDRTKNYIKSALILLGTGRDSYYYYNTAPDFFFELHNIYDELAATYSKSIANRTMREIIDLTYSYTWSSTEWKNITNVLAHYYNKDPKLWVWARGYLDRKAWFKPSLVEVQYSLFKTIGLSSLVTLRKINENLDFIPALKNFLKKNNDQLLKLKSMMSKSYICFDCKTHFRNDQRYEHQDHYTISGYNYTNKLIEEILDSETFPNKDDLNNIYSLFEWIKKKKLSTRRAINRKNDRRAQKNPRWAVARYVDEFYRGLRIAPLYEDIMHALEGYLLRNKDVIIAVHGRDGEIVYELAKVLYPELYKKMVYFVTSRPLTSQRSRYRDQPGYGEALIKYDGYINRILSKDQPALHFDTGFAGSIPEWFSNQGWSVDDIKLVSSNNMARGLFGGRSRESELREIVIYDLEHTPQRLAKISNISQWGSLKYSKHAPGFWSRLYGIIAGITQNKRIACTKGKKKDWRVCPHCMSEKLRHTAKKRRRKQVELKDLKKTYDTYRMRTWEDD